VLVQLKKQLHNAHADASLYTDADVFADADAGAGMGAGECADVSTCEGIFGSKCRYRQG
jgi:hypothetical protein